MSRTLRLTCEPLDGTFVCSTRSQPPLGSAGGLLTQAARPSRAGVLLGRRLRRGEQLPRTQCRGLPDVQEAFLAGAVAGTLATIVLQQIVGSQGAAPRAQQGGHGTSSSASGAQSSASTTSRSSSSAEEREVGGAILQAAARGPEGLLARARSAYKSVNAAANEGVQEYALSGDFSAVGRRTAQRRQELVQQVIEELQSGRADVDSVAQFLVDAALARAARCVNGSVPGGSGIYEELWSLDEGRASVAAVPREPPPAGGRQAKEAHWEDLKRVSTKDIVVDEQRQSTTAVLRPLFAQVQPHVFSKLTALRLLEVFNVFQQRQLPGDYTQDERQKIRAFLDEINRTPVMRRCRAEAAKFRGEPFREEEWCQRLWDIWFSLPPGVTRCGFEHVFIGEASVDANGRGVVGGLHNWFKFYLEEQRGAARYLGERYPGRIEAKEAAASNPRYVSGRFTWDLQGMHLVKDVGGFFVGVSPEWQIAMATTAFFETACQERALQRKWSPDLSTRDEGYMRVVKLGQNVQPV
eukprot:TRINITY_DN45336_c0_g1_i2.p1 TRINITY_DN45336_c0_g1~~TRINITY_DN45336_c0_g1_i2.p1  ORF type:complete len:523 (-),score=100.58 TRINITY_DN45336_c0_g1_i2:30-1598(-)